MEQQAIEFYSIPVSQQFRVVAVKVTEAKVNAKSLATAVGPRYVRRSHSLR